MGEKEVSSRTVRRFHVLEEHVKDPANVVNAEDETEEAAERRASKRGQSVRSSKHKGEQAEEEVVTRELMGTDVVDAVSLELRSLKLNDDCYGNSRSAGIVLNVVPQEFVANMERSLARGDDAAGASRREYRCLLSGEGDKDDSVMDLKSAAEQGYTSTALSRMDTAFLAELMRVIQRGCNWKKLTVPHMKAYMRHHGLRISGEKRVLEIRIEQHLNIKDGQGEDIHPRSSFNINCQGDACRGDIVLFLQTVYDFCRPLGERWVAGKVVHESYGAKEQQHTFTIEVLWSMGTKPRHFMQQLLIKGGSNSRPSSRLPSKTQHYANSSCNMPMQSSIQHDSQQKVYWGNSSVAVHTRSCMFCKTLCTMKEEKIPCNLPYFPTVSKDKESVMWHAPIVNAKMLVPSTTLGSRV